MQPFLAGGNQVRFAALQETLVPRAKNFGEAERAESWALVDALVGGMPAANRRKLSLFLRLIDVLAWFRGARGFRHLPEPRRRALLDWLFDCPVGLLRKGFWGLNTVAKLSVYGRTAIYEEIGYRPRVNPDG